MKNIVCTVCPRGCRLVVDGDTVLGSHGKIEIYDDKFIYYDANGNRVPISVLDY